MGWNSFNAFGFEITEERLRGIADVLVDSGLRDAGYTYLLVDDGWSSETRDPVSQRIMVDPVRFPSGMKAFADYVHSRGLELGLFSSRGLQSCGRLAGSYGFEVMDAETFADWGVDYLKHANCWLPEGREGSTEMVEDYRKMGDAFQATGRDIFYNL